MNSREVEIEQEPNQGSHFARIPEDLLLCILGKMDDLKYLCQCCLVSKRFRSTIYLSKTVSLTLFSNEKFPIQSPSDVISLIHKFSSLNVEEVIRFIRSSSFKWLNFLLVLQKFKQLESISLKFTCPTKVWSSSLFNWKVRISDSESLIERIICIIPSRVYKVIEQGHHFESIDMSTFGNAQMTLGCCVQWVLVLRLLLKCHPALKGVYITNSNKPWTLVLKDKEFAALRKCVLREDSYLGDMRLEEMKVGFMSELRLPFSGYVMMGVKFLIGDAKSPSHSGSSSTCATCKNESLESDAMTSEFVEEIKIINEAVHQILDKNY